MLYHQGTDIIAVVGWRILEDVGASTLINIPLALVFGIEKLAGVATHIAISSSSFTVAWQVRRKTSWIWPKLHARLNNPNAINMRSMYK
jgi:hypothetical protein